MITPTQQYYRHAVRKPEPVTKGLDQAVHRAKGRIRRRPSVRRGLLRQARKALALVESDLVALSREELSERIIQLHAEFRRNRAIRDGRYREALAHVAAASRMVLGLTPYEEQLAGALAVHEGCFAEMATGEGKTLTIALAGIMAGWTGNPCHIITSNGYLAQRDAESMQDLFAFCGLHAGHVISDMDPTERRRQYVHPVVYTTSQELLADFLRDRLLLGADWQPARRLLGALAGDQEADGRGLVLRGLHTAIVDEGDNVLIDEAVTPLVISRQYANAPFTACCRIARDIALSLQEGRDYKVDTKEKQVTLTPAGESRIERHRHRMPPIWRSLDRRNELVRTALSAEKFFLQDTHYAVVDGKVEIIDEFTGRILPGRTWKQGLHQAIEAKSDLEITDPTETMASMSFQRFFRLFTRLAALSGTAWESAGELWHIYGLPVVRIPTHRPCIREVLPAKVYPTAAAKYEAVAEETVKLARTGRAVLVGTRTVGDSERLSALLQQQGVAHDLLNAVRHEEEAAIVSRAGQPGHVTIATNMAGRGTDIQLDPAVRDSGGLHVIVAEPNLSGRIDRQLEGRAGRQGDPGSARKYYSLEDELFLRFLPHLQRRQLGQVLRQGVPGSIRMLLAGFHKAQRSAERLGAKQRRSVLKMDTWLDEQLSFTRPESRL